MPIQTFATLTSGKQWDNILKILKKEKKGIVIAKRSPYKGAVYSFSLTGEGFEFRSTYTHPVNAGFCPTPAYLVNSQSQHIMAHAKIYGNRLSEKKLVAKILRQIKKIKDNEKRSARFSELQQKRFDE